MKGFKGHDMKDLDVKGLEPSGGERMASRAFDMRNLDVKGFEHTGGE